jgi:hypothetical protein
VTDSGRCGARWSSQGTRLHHVRGAGRGAGPALSGTWTIEQALRGSSIALVSALIAIGWIAVRRVRLPVWQKLIVLFAEFAPGTAVIALERLAHG